MPAIANKPTLQPGNTVITQKDGEKKDVSLASLPNECVDENGAWGTMDENAALGLSSGTTSEKEADSSASEKQDTHPVEKSHALASAHTPAPSTNPADHFADGPSEAHGHLGSASWTLPRVAVYCEANARVGYNTSKGHEYLDSPAVLREKVQLLAQLLRAARTPVFYAGAGLSTASGIGDYATQTGAAGVLASVQRGSGSSGSNGSAEAAAAAAEAEERRRRVSPFCARPNLGHRVIAALGRAGRVWRFVQQNHDGLPQKAGMPQHLLNEIHGAWFDPSNPVVAMSGGLRGDLFADLLECERRADLVVAVGSSLCGMNADRLVVTSALRSRQDREWLRSIASVDGDDGGDGGDGGGDGSIPRGMAAFGSVIISIQKTVHDHNSSLRIFALIDDVMRLLAEEMHLNVPAPTDAAIAPTPEHCPLGPATDVFSVPYDAAGERTVLTGAADVAAAVAVSPRTSLDLREGAELVVASGPNRGHKAIVLGRNRDGHFRISVQRYFKNGTSGRGFTEPRLLGNWWPSAAVAGLVPRIPLVAAAHWEGGQ